MKTILLSAVALGAMTGAAFAEPAKMDLGQLNQVAAGLPGDTVTTTNPVSPIDPTVAPVDNMPTDVDPSSIGGGGKSKGGDGGYCCYSPSLDLAAVTSKTATYREDGGAAVHYGSGLGGATFGAASITGSSGFAWGLAGGF